MSAFPDAEVDASDFRATPTPWVGLSPVQYAAIATALAVLGVSTIWFPMRSLWNLWTTDALKSIGMGVPLVSLILILRVWRSLGWHAEGSWWGLPLVLLAIGLARIQEQMVLIMVISPRWSTALPPPQLALLAYGAGAVLLLGGTRLFRAALFPVLLLWFANPVPHIFSLMVDLPLQEASAHIARAFAMKLGHPLTRDHLRLMFTPDFGMFIAPGCNGIRGSVTMGFIALIAGYLYRFRWYANVLVVVGAVLLGYIFNLARLCLLVLYYGIALHFPSLQNKAEGADYMIGGALFLVATFLLFGVVQSLREAKNSHEFKMAWDGLPESQRYSTQIQFAQPVAMTAIVLLSWSGLPRANAVFAPKKNTAVSGSEVTEWFTPRVGNYTLTRTWTEVLVPGPVVYVWAQYVPADGGVPVGIGVSPVLSWHDPLICHLSRGETPIWQGQLTIATADAVPVSFSSAFYSDGVTRYLEASTICSGERCGEFTTQRTHFGFLYTHPDPQSLLGNDRTRPIPVLVRIEMTNMAVPLSVAKLELTKQLTAFLASAKLDQLARTPKTPQ